MGTGSEYYIRRVKRGTYLSLRKGEEKQKYGLDFPIEREPEMSAGGLQNEFSRQEMDTYGCGQ
jgi:hypothetical protein